jgi:DNA-binding PucR family transcriptional regulator
MCSVHQARLDFVTTKHRVRQTQQAVVDATVSLLDALVDGKSHATVEALLTALGRAAAPPAQERLRASYYRARDALAGAEHRLERLRDVHDMAGDLGAIHDLNVVLKAITNAAQQLLRCDYVYLDTPAEIGQQVFAVRVWSGALTAEMRGIQVSVGHGVGGMVLETGEPFQVENYLASTDFVHDPSYDRVVANQGISTLLCVPLTVSGYTVGLLFAARRRELRFSDEDVFLLSALATHAAITLHNAQLNEDKEHALSKLARAVADSEQTRHAAVRSTRMYLALNSILLHGGGLANILDAARQELRLALAYVDRTFAAPVVTRSGEIEEIPDTTLLDPPDSSRTGSSLRFTTDGSQRWAIVDIAVQGRLLGHLLARWSATPDPEVAAMLERAGQVVALSQLSVLALADADRRTAADLVTRLVQSPQRLTTDLKHRIRRHGIDDIGPIIALADTTDPAAIQAAENWTVKNGGLSVLQEDALVILAPAGRREALDQLARKILRQTAGTNVILGRDPRGLAAAPAEFIEAQHTLALARALGYSGALLNVELFGIFSMLFTDPTKPDLEMFIHGHIGPLLDQDAHHHTDLTGTARVLLENNLSLRASAAVLEVHPNTVNQRAGHISRLLGPDWRAQPRAFGILAALKLHSLQSPPAPVAR